MHGQLQETPRGEHHFTKPKDSQGSQLPGVAAVNMRGLRFVKRALDVVVAAVGLAILLPVFVVVGVAVGVTMGWPLFFRQERVGYHGDVFQLRKFRTMQDRRGGDGELLPDDERLTRLGRFLRASSIDELPELLHVLTGQMSLVGPRPLLIQYLSLYTAEQMRRHDVLPGITGWAQINGRNATTWEERFALDVWYVDNWSIRLDLTILRRTFGLVFRRTGINYDGHATMPLYAGPTPPEDEAS